MKRPILIPLLAFAGLLAACVPSLQPFYTEADLVTEPKLIGRWSADNSSDTWEFRKDGEKAYTMIYTDKDGRAGQFDARLFKLGDHMLLDIVPDGDSFHATDLPDVFNAHLLPAHTLIRIESVGPTLMMGFMNVQWLDEHLRENPDAISHSHVKNRVILTATTRHLQAFVRKHGSEEGFFTKPMDLLPD